VPRRTKRRHRGGSYFFSKKICLQSALPVFSAECEAMAERAVAVEFAYLPAQAEKAAA
jgi:hypothetical protein